jgi:hypothetical protein
VNIMMNIMLKSEKIIGYALLTMGIILLVFSIVEMMNIYYGNSPPPNLFALQDISLSTGQNGEGVSLIQGAQASQIANLFFWSILMAFLLFAGGKIASLGVTMVKDIQVQVKEAISAPSEVKSV